MLDSDTKRRIDTARDILVGKVPDPKSQVEQITIALIYKFMDDMDAEAEELGGKRSFFAGAYARYGWAKLMRSGLGGHEMLALYAEAITKMPENPGIPALFRDIFKNAYLPYRDPETLRAFLKIIDEFSYDHSERLGDAFEYLLSVLGSQGDAGQFRTPRHIIDFMVRLLDPKKGETVLDPACGTAGFLISAFKHIRDANTDSKGNTTLTPDERGRLAKHFLGYDISPDMVRLSLVNLYLHAFPDPHVYEYDTLTSEERWNEFADVILANPPFMSPKGGIKPHKRFSIQAKRSEVLFVDYMAEHLTPKGRAAIIVPEGIIFQSQSAYKDLRKMLVEQSLVTVISLPAGCFNPYSGVKTSILILDKTLARQSGSIGFFKVENDGFGLGAQRRAIEKNDLPQVQAEVAAFLQAIRDRKPTADLEPTCGFIVPKEKIVANGDYNLSGERYREGAANVGLTWPLVPIGDLCVIERGASPRPIQDFMTDAPDGVNWIKIGDAEVGAKYITTTKERVTPEGAAKSRRVKPGDFLLSNSMSFGRPYVMATDGCIHDGWLLLRDQSDQLDQDYLYNILGSKLVYAQFKQAATGGVVNNLNSEIVRGVKIPLPPLSVQQEIVAEIEGYQKIIDGARAVLDHYRPHIPIQPDWPTVELGNHFNTSSGGTPSKSEPNYWKGGIPWVSPKDMKSDVIHDTEDHITAEAVSGSGTKIFPEDTVVCVVRSGILKHSFPVALLSRPMCINQDLIAFRPKGESVIPKFLFYVLKTRASSILAEGIKPGVTVQSFYNGFFKEYQIPLPPLATQEAIVAEIEAEQALVAANRELIARFEKKVQATLARVWGEEEPKALDCGSPLPLSDPQPAAGVTEEAKEEPPRHVNTPRASRLAPEKRQQAAAVQVVQVVQVTQATHEEEPSRPTHPDDLDKSDLMALFRDLLNRHGPTERQAVIRLAAAELGYQRLREGVSSALDKALVTAVRRWVLINYSGVLSVYQNNIAEYNRKHLKSQLLAAISEHGRVWMEREDAIRAFSRWLGFRRAGPRIDETARSLINALVRKGELESSGNAIRRV